MRKWWLPVALIGLSVMGVVATSPAWYGPINARMVATKFRDNYARSKTRCVDYHYSEWIDLFGGSLGLDQLAELQHDASLTRYGQMNAKWAYDAIITGEYLPDTRERLANWPIWDDPVPHYFLWYRYKRDTALVAKRSRSSIERGASASGAPPGR
jgi:hypothetical protein